MRKLVCQLIIICVCICSSCSKQVIEEPQLDNPYDKEYEYGDFSVNAEFIDDVSATIVWRGKSLGGRFDMYINDTLFRTMEKSSKDTLVREGLYHLSPDTKYDIKVRWVPQSGDVKFGKVSFTTKSRFHLESFRAVNLDKYAFESYAIVNAIKCSDGMLYTLTCKKSAYNAQDYVIVIKTDSTGEIEWDREFALSGLRNTRMMGDGSILLVTRKNVYHISLGGNILRHYDFNCSNGANIEIRDAVLLADGRMVAVGSSVRKWGKDDTLWEEFYVASLSKDGKIVSETISSDKKFNKFERVELMENGNLLAVGVKADELDGHMSSYEYRYYQGTFITAVLSDNAQIVEQNEYGDFECYNAVSSLKGKDGNFYFLVRDMSYFSWGSDECCGVVGIDNNGNLIKHVSYNNSSTTPFKIFENGDEIIITHGSRILVTQKLGEKTNEWLVRGYKFVYVEKVNNNILCIDQMGYAMVFNTKGCVKEPFEVI